MDFGIVCLVLAALLGVPGVWTIRRRCKKLRTWRIGTGTVIGKESYQDSHFPVVEVVLPDGRRYNFTASVGSGRRPSIGAEFKVVYDPEDPSEGDLLWNFWFGPIVLVLIATLFLVFAVLAYV